MSNEASRALSMAIQALRDIRERAPGTRAFFDYDAFIMNELNPGLVAAHKWERQLLAMKRIVERAEHLAAAPSPTGIRSSESEQRVQADVELGLDPSRHYCVQPGPSEKHSEAQTPMSAYTKYEIERAVGFLEKIAMSLSVADFGRDHCLWIARALVGLNARVSAQSASAPLPLEMPPRLLDCFIGMDIENEEDARGLWSTILREVASTASKEGQDG